ncbi:hypothetical protein BgAZ_401170 [Babesia gibsoni]|uniref:Cell-traversal protein for ookinetes and sporozoites domain-containing protein n=1 Tax=Babesia gibsoni TaxID=33632 RepID=A0AAD8LIA9_BABGI|nr:hypothetical protein BgAZ_401170 [Babesia gibsoni]
MKLLAAVFSFIAFQAFGLAVPHHRGDGYRVRKAHGATHKDVEKLRDQIGTDVETKANELLDLLVADVEKLLKEAYGGHPAFIQNPNTLKETSKKIMKNGVIAITKHMLPVFEAWIADAVKPPVTTPMVYAALVRPIGKSIFDQMYTKLQLPHTAVWDRTDNDSLEIALTDEVETAESK